MTFYEFKSEVENQNPGVKIRYREHGKHGWTSIEVNNNGLYLKPGNDGPHWIDAATIPAGYWLLGTFDVKTGSAKFYKK